MATTYNFPDHIKGDTMQAVNFTVTVNASPLNLTGATIKMDLRTSNGNLRKRFSSVDDDGISITNAAGGVFSVIEQIIDVPAMTYKYDIEITLADDSVRTYIAGTWTITQDQTYD
jgi:hypothetical protein